ncbi:MAG: protein BatD [Alistipes sp.]|nr:protein BatD [Alistipes sp.]
MMRLRHFLLVLSALMVSWAASAQVSFTVDAPALTALGQPFRVAFTVDAEPEDGSFKAPSFDGFEVMAGPSVSTGHSVQFINGKKSSSYNCTYTFVLMPHDAGTYTIGAASIRVDGKGYTTKSLPIEVIAEKQSGASASSGGSANAKPESRIGKDDILLRLKVSSTDLYKGESLRASLVLYTRATVENIESLTLPSFDGFWSQELTFDNAPSREEYNGRVYETYKITELLLSPQESGKIVIPEAVMSVGVQVVVQDKRHYDPIFGGRQVYRVSRELKSVPVTINVKELPKGAPHSFNGAVGSFTLRSTMPEAEIDVNSADQIELTLSGMGNLKFITAPTVAFPESFEVYDTKVVDNIKLSASGTSGSITYTYPFVARAAGLFTIPGIEFSYFDPVAKEYKRLTTEPFSIEVKDDGSTQAVAPVPTNYGNYGGPMRQLDRDIRYIHTGKLPNKSAAAFVFTPLYWLVVVAMVALFIVVYVVLRKRIRERSNTVARRMRHADKVAVQRLRMAERYMAQDDRHAFYDEMLHAMWGYIGDKFNIPVSNLTKEKIREELYRRNVSETTAEQFCEIISRSEEAQYAPSTTGDMGEVYGDAVDVISKIEAAIKR